MILREQNCVTDLVAASPLAAAATDGEFGAPLSAPGVTLELCAEFAIATVIARRGRLDSLRTRVADEFGIELPPTPKCVSTNGVAFVWSGPEQWLVLGKTLPATEFVRRLASSLGNSASINEQTDGRAVIRVGGPAARQALAKICALDLHRDAFKPGDAAVTRMAQLNVSLWQIDEAPRYEIAVFSTFALSLWESLVTAAAEFGGIAHSGGRDV
jgi:methylglutamate dehydrogenase subunit D